MVLSTSQKKLSVSRSTSSSKPDVVDADDALEPVLPVVAVRIDLVDDVAEHAVRVVIEVRARRREARDGADSMSGMMQRLVQARGRHRAAHAQEDRVVLLDALAHEPVRLAHSAAGEGRKRLLKELRRRLATGQRRAGRWRERACVFLRRSSSRQVSIPAPHGPDGTTDAALRRGRHALGEQRLLPRRAGALPRPRRSSTASRGSRRRRKLREVEAVRTKSAGYGSLNYAISLCETYELLLGPTPAATRQQIEQLGRDIYEHAIELLPGVRETIAELATRHTLWIVTKGHYEEQLSKIERCGIAHAFAGYEILPEKCPETFRELVGRHAFDPARTWMIGNSPRSDINTAIAVGLRTVHIPHRTIWEFEHEEFVRPPDLSLKAFPDLLKHF